MPEASRRVEAGGAVLAAEVSTGERGALVDVEVAQRALPAGRALAQEAVVLVDARRAVTTRVAQALAHRQQLRSVGVITGVTHTHTRLTALCPGLPG